MPHKPMPMDFALAVQRLNRQGLTVAAIADELQADQAWVMEAHRILALPANDAGDPMAYPSETERAALLERLPKRMQDRIRRSRH